MRRFSIIAAGFLFPTTAFAHTGTTGHDLVHGFTHPLGGLDHILAMVAVGTLAAMLGGRAIWALPLSFIAMMIVGFALGIIHLNLPLAEFAIVLSIIAIGGTIAWAGTISLPSAMMLVGAFSLFHGYAHGIEAPVDTDPLPYIGGFVAATATLHAVGLAVPLLLLRLNNSNGHAMGRVAGGAFVLGGLGLLLGWL